MSSKPVADSDRQQFPQCRHQLVKIGEDAVGIVVRREVDDGGVRNLTREQVQSIFAKPYLATQPLVALVPGIAITLTAVGFTLAGDGLRNALDSTGRG